MPACRSCSRKASSLIAWRAGAALVLADPHDLMPGEPLRELITRQRITTVLLPPSALAALPSAELSCLTTLIVGGEACAAEQLRPWLAGRTVLNAYGPTEASVCTTLFGCGPDERRPPIGRPPGARLSRPPRPHRRALRARPVRPRRAALPHRRPGALARRWRARLPRPPRYPGEDPRLPHRARRDRSRPAGTTRHRARRRHRPRRCPRQTPRRLSGRTRRGPRPARRVAPKA